MHFVSSIVFQRISNISYCARSFIELKLNKVYVKFTKQSLCKIYCMAATLITISVEVLCLESNDQSHIFILSVSLFIVMYYPQ